jgi:hypothetical protein
MKNENGNPTYYDGNDINNVVPVSEKNYKEVIIKPNHVENKVVYPCFPYLNEENYQ